MVVVEVEQTLLLVDQLEVMEYNLLYQEHLLIMVVAAVEEDIILLVQEQVV
jgi:hypothetical protein